MIILMSNCKKNIIICIIYRKLYNLFNQCKNIIFVTLNIGIFYYFLIRIYQHVLCLYLMKNGCRIIQTLKTKN